MLRRILGCAALLVAGLHLAPAQQSWIEVRTPNFTVLSNAGEKKARAAALRFERMRHIFGAITGRDKVRINTPLLIVAFRDHGEMQHYMPLWKGKPMKGAALSIIGAPDRDYIVIELSGEHTSEMTNHEYAHILLHGNFPGMPVWFDEGFAEYYSTLQVNDKEAELGDLPVWVPYVLKDERWMTSTDLFSITHRSPLYNESNRQTGVFYAQSWLVVHYLFDRNKLNQAAEYAELRSTRDMPVAQAIEQAFHTSPKKFDEEIFNYYNSHSAGLYRFPTPPGLEVSFQVSALDPVRLRVEMADLQLHAGNIDAAMAEFQAVLKLDPNNALAFRGLGYAYLQKGDFPHAQEQFLRAAELAVDDPMAHYLWATSMHREKTTPSRPELDLMQQHLIAATQLAPEFADAYDLLANVNAASGELDRAIAAELKAISFSPREEMFRVHLAGFYIDSGIYGEARKLLREAGYSGDPTVSGAADKELERLEKKSPAPKPASDSEHQPSL